MSKSCCLLHKYQQYIVTGISATITFSLLMVFVAFPMWHTAYSNTVTELDSTNSCSGLIILNTNIGEGKYEGLTSWDGNHIQDLLKSKLELLKCP